MYKIYKRQTKTLVEELREREMQRYSMCTDRKIQYHQDIKSTESPEKDSHKQ